MGFKLNINNILRMDFSEVMQEGRIYDFSKDAVSVLADDLTIWLTKTDWTALAEIKVLSQTRAEGKTFGKFQITHIYGQAESEALTAIFRRMYGWK